MRSTVVPAQVTTVEDKITGNLGLSQLLLLTVPIFGGSAFFVVLPPFFSYALYKVVLIAVFSFTCGLLAIRIKGRILLLWLAVILKYNLRPRFYVFNKNSQSKRELPPETKAEKIKKPDTKKEPSPSLQPQLGTAEKVRIEGFLSNPQANLRFKTNRKGELRAYITEVQ